MVRISIVLLATLTTAAASPPLTPPWQGGVRGGGPIKKDAPPAEKGPSSSGPAPKIVLEAPTPGDVEIHFLNGSVVRMILHSEKLEIATPYGPLAVPVKDVRAIEFGLHFPEGAEAKINLAVKSLGAKEYRERDKAGRSLLELGPYSYPAVYEACRSDDLETARRAKDVLKQLQAKHPKKDLKTSADDKLVTPTFAIVGRILTPTIKAKTELFGQVELSLAKMRTLKAIAGPSQELDVTIDAAKYAIAGQWMETNFQVDGRSGLVITAKGAVDTWPQGPGQYMVGPHGALGGALVLGGGRRVVGGAIGGQINGGALIGKIGENGEPFIIGDNYDGNPETEGKLYLHIGPSPWNCASTGSYEVKIGRK